MFFIVSSIAVIIACELLRAAGLFGFTGMKNEIFDFFFLSTVISDNSVLRYEV